MIPFSDEEEAGDNLYFLPVAPEIDDPEVCIFPWPLLDLLGWRNKLT